MKKLKKISLQKEELMSLNSPQMDMIRGGESHWTGGYNGELYVFGDPYDDPYGLYWMDYLVDNGMNQYTSQWTWSGNGSCLMGTVYVNP